MKLGALDDEWIFCVFTGVGYTPGSCSCHMLYLLEVKSSNSTAITRNVAWSHSENCKTKDYWRMTDLSDQICLLFFVHALFQSIFINLWSSKHKINYLHFIGERVGSKMYLQTVGSHKVEFKSWFFWETMCMSFNLLNLSLTVCGIGLIKLILQCYCEE